MKISRFPIRRGMSLMEVLAATFVIGIGLIGALAVLPFGAIQVSKARDTETASVLLAAASQQIALEEMAKPERWKRDNSNTLSVADEFSTTDAGATNLYYWDNSNSRWAMDLRRVYMVDPFAYDVDRSVYGQGHTFSTHVYRICRFTANTNVTTNFPAADSAADYQIRRETKRWRNLMTGPDDLQFTYHKDKRPDFSDTREKVMSSGRFTWFFTFSPKKNLSSYDSPGNLRDKRDIPYSDIAGNSVDVDLLACYNRIPGTERSVTIDTNNSSSTVSGGKIRLRAGSAAALDLSTAKYIFVTWQSSDYGNASIEDWFEGAWCKVVNASEPEVDTGNNDYYRDVIVTASDLPSAYHTNSSPKALIIDGVQLHLKARVDL